MSEYRWNNRFNPPLETASINFPKRVIDVPTVPANSTTRPAYGARFTPVYTNQITSVPPISITTLDVCSAQLTVNMTLSFGYNMTGTDHVEFTFTNSNTNVSTTKSFQPATSYTVGEFDPGVTYFVYVTPYINGLYTAPGYYTSLSATSLFLSSFATAPGILQGLQLTGSGSYAKISYTGVYPSNILNQIAVDDNLGDIQFLVPVTSTSGTIVIGPYTNGSGYQFQLAPVTGTAGQILRYGNPIPVPAGSFFIPGPPGTPNVTTFNLYRSDLSLNVNADTTVHPQPVSYLATTYQSSLTKLLSTLTGSSSVITDLSQVYCGFSVSTGLLTPLNFSVLSSAVSACNLVADITDDYKGSWYSFRVTSATSNASDGYVFTNSNLAKAYQLTATSTFSVNFSNVTLGSQISSYPFTSPTVVISNIQTSTFTTVLIKSFANNVYSDTAEYLTIFAGAPSTPTNVLNEVGNQTFRWTVGLGGGPRPTSYNFYAGSTQTTLLATSSSVVGTISGLTNLSTYSFNAVGYANGLSSAPLTITGIVPDFAAPTSLSVTSICDTTVNLAIGRPLGGALGYLVQAISGASTVVASKNVSDAVNPTATFINGTLSAGFAYSFKVYSQDTSYPPPSGYDTNLSAATSTAYYLGAPRQTTNIQGSYAGVTNVSDGTTPSALFTLTSTWAGGVPVTQYQIVDSYQGTSLTASADQYYNLNYSFTVSSYVTHQFTVTPFGNNLTGPSAQSSSFNLNPQPPTSASLLFSGNQGLTLTVTFAGPAYTAPNDYYTILPLLAQNISGQTQSSPFQNSTPVTSGYAYQFAVYSTICGIVSLSGRSTNTAYSGPPAPPLVTFTLGSNQINFTLLGDPCNNVVISNYQITEYFSNISSGYVQTGLPPVIVPVTPSTVPSTATSTISGTITVTSTAVRGDANWDETNSVFPTFSSLGCNQTDPLQLNTYSNLVTLTLCQGLTTLSFPVTAYSFNSPNVYTYGTNLTVKPDPSPMFDGMTILIFTWASGTGPFFGGSYRYDIVSLGYSTGGNTLTSITPNSQYINFYVPVPGTPSVSVSNTTVSVNVSASTDTTVVPQYYTVTDNFGTSVSGATTLSSFVFSGLTAGTAYQYTVTAFSNGIQSVSSLPVEAYPGIPGPPGISNFDTSFVKAGNGTATATFNTFVGTSSYFVPLTDICLTVAQGTAGYSISKTNILNVYESNGPTYTLTNLSAGSTYIFTLSAYGNQVYSTLSSVYSLYIGSIPPNGSPSVLLSNTTAYVSVSAANVTSRVGAVHPTSYVFTSTLCGSGVTTTVTVPYYSASNTYYTGVFTDLIALSNYSFSVYTVTNGFCGNVLQAGVYNAGGPRDALFSLSSATFPAGNPATINVSLQITFATGYTSPPGLWTDTAYYFQALAPFSNFYQAASGTSYSWSPEITVVSPITGTANIIVGGGGGCGGMYGSGGLGGLVKYTYTNIIVGDNLKFILGNGTTTPGEAAYSSVVTLPNGIQLEAGAGGGAISSYNDPVYGLIQVPGLPGQSLLYTPDGGQCGIPGLSPNGGPGNGTAWDPVNSTVITLPGLTVIPGGNTSSINGYVSIAFLSAVVPPTLMTSNVFTGSVPTGYSYEIDVYGIKNQVQGKTLSASIIVPPALPISPTITVNPQDPPQLNIQLNTPIPATVSWTPSPTPGSAYYYFINTSAGGLTFNSIVTVDEITLSYGYSAKLYVQAVSNSLSSAFVSSPTTLISTNPPTNLTYARNSNIVTLSWGTAYQPPYYIPGTISNYNYAFTVSTATNAGVNAIYISSAGGGPSVTFGSTLLTPAMYSQIVASIGSNEPIFVSLSGTAYNQSFQVNSFNPQVVGSQIIGYQMSNTNLAALPSYSGVNLYATITNPSSLPTDGYTIWDTCGGAIIASNIYSNTYTWTGGVLGQRYNIAVQALNSNLYSPTASASAEFILSTTPVSLLSVSNIGSTVTLSWTTPVQDDGVRPTTNPPYYWNVYDQSGTFITTGSTLSTSTFVATLGKTYTYSIVTSYYGVSSTPTVGNPISLFTNPPTAVTQTTYGPGIVLTWGAAMQTVYFPNAPTVATSQYPNGGYSITDLAGNYGSVLTVSSNLTELYISISSAALGVYRNYNFAITALHGSICSTQVAPGPVFLGVNPVTNLTVTTLGNLATLRWLPALTNGPNSPYIIYDGNGNQIGDPSTSFVRTLTYSTPGIYSITTLATELVSVYAYGAGGSVGAGGFASNTYSVNSNTTIIINVGQAGAGGGNSTVYVPNPANPYLILDAGGGGGYTVSGLGFIRNGGVSDGGGPGLPGFGSGGSASLGGGSPAGVDGKVVITLTTQTLSAALSVGTGITSITFPIINNTNYALTVASYSNGLVATASLGLNTIISAPSNLITSNDGLYLANSWTVPVTQPTGYLLTNLTTGTFNTPGLVSSSVFTEPGVNGTSYRFSLIALSNGLPSTQAISSPITLFCPAPSNFNSSYNGTTITFTASGNPGFGLETYTLTDGNGLILQTGLPQFGIGSASSAVQISPVTRVAGSTYTFRLYGTINGLSSGYLPTSVNLVIPGSTSLETPPFISNATSSTVTGSNALNIYPCTPTGDTWNITPTSLVRRYNQYTGVPGLQDWNSVAMTSNGRIMLASDNDSSTGSNIWISLNGGLNWTGATNPGGRAGYTASNVAIALNGTTAMVATTGGLWMSSNVGASAPWSNITIPTANIQAVAVSPDGSRVVYTPTSVGTVYYATMSGYPNLAFYGANGPVDPVSSRVFGQTQWAKSGLAWSGDGTTVVVAAGANPCGLMYISTDYAETFSVLPVYVFAPGAHTTDPTPRSFTNIAINCNATTILASYNENDPATPSNQVVRRYTYGGMGAYPNYWAQFILNNGGGSFTVPYSTGTYKSVVSFGGDIQIICDSSASSVFTSYDQGYSWYVVTYFQNSSGYLAAAVSVDGLTQIVLGKNTYLQTLISTPQPTSSVLQYAANNYGQTVYNVPAGVDGYTITPSLKNITGPSEYVWTTPTPGPSFYAQTTTGTASLCGSPYASGYSNYGGVTAMFLVINITNPVFPQSQTFNISQVSTYPAITSSKYYSNSDSITYLIQNSGYTASNMSPGLYVFSVGATTGGNTCNSPAEVYIPPPPPTGVTIGGGSGGTQLSVTWTAPTNTYFQSSPTYDVYSNGSFLLNTASTNATMANSGSATLVQIRTSNVGFTSTFASATSAPPDPPAGMTITGYSDVSNVSLTWTSNYPTTYNISYGSTTSNGVSSPFVVPLPPGSNIVIGLTALSNNLLSTKSILTCTNRIGTATAAGITTNVNMTTNFIVTSMRIVAGGGGGGAGGWGGNAISTQGGGGGAQGGTLLFSNGTGPIQPPSVITLAAGKAGTAGTAGNGGGGGTGSYVQLTGNVVSYASGGGGGGGGNGRAGGSGTGYAGVGAGGTGGDPGTNNNGGGGGFGGGQGSLVTFTGDYTSNTGSNGSSRGAAGGAVYSNYGGAGGGIGAGGQQTISGSTGNYATVVGCAGGGGAGGVAFSTNPSNSAMGGSAADGLVTISYVYLTG